MTKHDIELPMLPAGCLTEIASMMRNYAHAAIKADRQQRGDIDYKQMFDQMCERCDALDAKLAEYSEQPTPAAQEPSDEDIRRIAREMYLSGDLIWIGFDRDEHGEYTQPTITSMDITLFRALLARYGSKS